MNIKNTVIKTIKEAINHRDSVLIGELTDDAVLLEIGLDSLGYAIVVTLLDEELGYDPFVEMNDPVYPQTLKEFVDIYEKYSHLSS